MQLETYYAWEAPLLSLAREAYLAQPNEQQHYFEPELLARAYDYCDSLTAVHSRSFHLASGLLPSEKRSAARALYAFCRVSDDLVDNSDGDCAADLLAWRERTASVNPPEDDLVAIAWTDARLCYSVPQRYAEQLLDGVAADLVKTRYANFDELAQYSYGVASTVGLMSMHIIGYSSSMAIPFAIKLGVALQITNILRDVAEDWARGRLYLPLEELAEFGLSEADIEAGQVTPAWQAFMRFQVERNRRLYAEAMPGIGYLHPSGRFAIRAAAELYQGILDDIERNGYDVFSRRAHVTKWGKLRLLPGIWWRSRLSVEG
jgi:phytoene synthase